MFDSKKSLREFLTNHYTKHPVLLRGRLTKPYRIDPSEVIILARDANLESRLVQGVGTQLNLTNGPLRKIPKASPWTVLVQDVDKWVPKVGKMLEWVHFLPHWMIEDIMVSFATKGGGVGPHVDSYDVFLVQISGTRRWHWGERPLLQPELLPDSDLRLLANPHFSRTALLREGDILYLPAGFAHEGIAEDNECVTYSIGIRSPNLGELLGAFDLNRFQINLGAQFATKPFNALTPEGLKYAQTKWREATALHAEDLAVALSTIKAHFVPKQRSRLILAKDYLSKKKFITRDFCSRIVIGRDLNGPFVSANGKLYSARDRILCRLLKAGNQWSTKDLLKVDLGPDSLLTHLLMDRVLC